LFFETGTPLARVATWSRFGSAFLASGESSGFDRMFRRLLENEELSAVMMIYVGNLDYAVTSDELRALFEPYGAVTLAEVQVKSRTGQSRGFGLVEMPEEAEAKAAIAALNGQDFRDRKLTVNESRPRRTVRDLYAGGGWFGGGAG
jgi:RNA recognition motif-containing protein